MKCFLLCFFVFFLPLSSLATPKILTVPDQYSTIQKAIDAAVCGDTVKVKPGLYRESLTFKDGVTLLGDDREKVIVKFDTRKGSALIASGCSGVISNLTFKSVKIKTLSDKEKYHPILKLSKSTIKVDNCVLKNGCDNGINIEDASRCEMTRCLVQDNRKNGIIVLGKGTSADLSENQCVTNGLTGIGYGEQATGTVTANDSSNNHKHGIIVTNNGTIAVLKNNKCNGNTVNGILFTDDASGEAEGNLCQDNHWHGVSVATSNSSVVLTNNQSLSNECSGFYFTDEQQVRAKGNICKNNKEINYGYLRSLLVEENFAELESIVDHLRTVKPRFRSSEWQLFYYYMNLAEGWINQKKSPALQVERILDRWRKAKPDSITPIIVLAYFYRDLAWASRGSDWAHNVTEEGWRGFKENLQKGWSILLSNENDKISDPMFYHAALNIRVLGMGQFEEMDGLFKKGIAIEPNFYPLYYMKQYILLPRWFGEPGQAEAFMEQATRENFETEGDSLRARMVSRLITCIGIKDVNSMRFDYKQIKRSYQDLIKRYPESNYQLNVFCLYAGSNGDWVQTLILIDKIGEKWDKSVWQTKKYYEGYRQWANKMLISSRAVQPVYITTTKPAK